MATAIKRWNGSQWVDILSTAYLRLIGDTMTGPIIWANDPTNDNHLARKKYVDDQVATKMTPTDAAAAFVNVSGDTMTGDLNFGNTRRVVALADPVSGLDAVHKQYVDGLIATRITPADADLAYVNVGGDTMTGPLRLPLVGDVALASTGHPFQIGLDTGINTAFDSNEIQARNNGAAAPLYLNYNGGNIFLGPNPGVAEQALTSALQWGWTRGPKVILYPGVTNYEIGIQPSGLYQRVSTSSGTFNWYAGGTYSDLANSAGLGGERIMSLTGPGKLTLHGAVAGEIIRIDTGTTGYMAFYEGTTRRGYVGQYPAGNLGLIADTGNLYLDAGTSGKATIIGPGSCTISGNTAITGTLSVSSSATISGSTTFTGAVTLSEPVAMPLKIIGAGTSGYIGFYEGSTRRAYVGHFPNNSLSCVADAGTATFAAIANDTYVGGSSGAASHLWLRAGSGQLMFVTGGNERGRVSDANFLWGMNSYDGNNRGITLSPSWLSVSEDSLNVPCFVANKIGDGKGGGSDFMHFRFGNVATGSIAKNSGNTAVNYNTTSDYRLKDERGEITDGLERVLRLRPLRVHWKEQPEDEIVDGFFAHEVDEVVPEAVTGEKDAVALVDAPDRGQVKGDIIPQQMDTKILIPIMVAALKELAGRVEALEN